MRRTISKFILAFFIHGIICISVYAGIIQGLSFTLLSNMNASLVLFTHILIAVYYFVFIWADLYKYDYNYFLSFSTRIIFRSLGYMVGFVFISIAFFYLLDYSFWKGKIFVSLPVEQYVFMIIILLFINSMFFLLLYLVKIQWIRHLVSLGYLKKNTIIFGNPDTRFPTDYVQTGNPTKSYKGTIFKNDGRWFFKNADNRVQIIQNSKITELIFKLQISEVIIFLCRELSKHDIYRLVDCLRENSISYSLVPDVKKLVQQKFWQSSFSYIPVIERYSTNRDSLTQITIKRLLDIIFVSISLLLVVPIGFVLAIMIKLEDDGPVFYIRHRVGKDGKLIKFLKFRSMRINAEAMREKLMQYNIRIGGPLFKMENDPRITRVGRFIRRFSLDELPQLLNVLRGDMSLVGPRPHLISEVEAYNSNDLLRLECIPGITCFPQIYGRSTLSFRSWIDLDLSYRKNWSISLDMKILFKSILIVVSPIINKTLY
ncbi:MAG: exopolysaccharide biosynthesis polyprenyl glycosylphosphotransferase [Spirochaetales bacterium]|nr:exopolysaccharide biosynthesis polyprenyl glycosylphosphotransferase [Spirochaetales bacterium]